MDFYFYNGLNLNAKFQYLAIQGGVWNADLKFAFWMHL